MCILCDIKFYIIIDIKLFNCVDNFKGGIFGVFFGQCSFMFKQVIG